MEKVLCIIFLIATLIIGGLGTNERLKKMKEDKEGEPAATIEIKVDDNKVKDVVVKK